MSGQFHIFVALLVAYCYGCHAAPLDDTPLLMPFLHQKAGIRSPRSNVHRSSSKSVIARALVQDKPAVPVGSHADKHSASVNQALLYKLYDDVLRTDYRKDVRPMPLCSDSGCPKRTEVKFGMRVLQILGLNPDDSTLGVQVILTVMWSDPRLAFDSSKYFTPGSWNSLEHSVSVKVDDIWVPDVGVANTADPLKAMLTDTNAVLYDSTKLKRDGFNVRIIQPAIVRVKCPVNLENFPMDKQSCDIVFRSSANAGWLKLTQVRNDTHLEAAALRSLVNTRDEYDVLSIKSKENMFSCPDTGMNIPEIVYTILLARRSEYYALNVVLPLQILSLLSVGTLYIAPGANRIFYGVTLALTLMSVTFFMGAFLPRTGGGNTWLELYEQNVYMAVITPLFFALLTEVYCRIRRRSSDFTGDAEAEKKLTDSVEVVDTYARIVFSAVIGMWTLKMAFDKLVMYFSGIEINMLPFKCYNWLIGVLIIIVIGFDIVGLTLKSKDSTAT